MNKKPPLNPARFSKFVVTASLSFLGTIPLLAHAGMSPVSWVSDNGSVVVHSSWRGSTHWTLPSTSEGLIDDASAITMINLGTLRDDNAGSTAVTAISATGNEVAGYSQNNDGRFRAFRWTPDAGSTTDGTMTDLGTLNKNDAGEYIGESFARSINATGNVVVGLSDVKRPGSIDTIEQHAFRWTLDAGSTTVGTMIDLRTLKDDYTGYSSADFTNATGNVVVGWSDTNGGNRHAFRWTLDAGSTTDGTMTDLGTLNKDDAGEYIGDSLAQAINATGSAVVGRSDTNSGNEHAFRWTLNAGSTTDGTMTDLGTLMVENAGRSGAIDINATGNVVVGWSETNGGNTHAFRWTPDAGSTTQGTMADLGTLGGESSEARAVNAAGDVVVGTARDASGESRAFRWTQDGMRSIEDWLEKDNRITVNDAAAKTRVATAVSADGNVVAGYDEDGDFFVAVANSGMIDTVEYTQSLSGTTGVQTVGMQDATTLLHGAHGSPMRGLLTAGKQDFWVAGDIGHTDNQGMSGKLGLGEIGISYGMSDQVMVKMALGRTYSKQDTMLGGSTRVDGTYIMPELIAKMEDTPLYATLSAYYNWGDADIKRGYTNAGNTEHSSGSTDTSTLALRARLDWLNAFKQGNTSFTPYASFTYTRAKVDAYAETGGGFDATWTDRKEHSTEARLGLDAVHPVSDKLKVLGRLEGVHRFDDRGGDTTVYVEALSASLPVVGQSFKRNWLRMGAGIEGALGKGTGSLMLNVSTQDVGADYWLAASYRVPF